MRKLTYKHWLACGGALAVLMFFAARIYKGEQCPVDLPAEYKMVEYSPRASSAALALNDLDGIKDNGTSSSWLFVARGSVEAAKDRVLSFLNRTERWRELPSRAFVVFSRDGRSPEVVLMPARFGDGRVNPSFHRIRVNGKWETSGANERVLALLPRSWLEKMAQDK